MAEYLTRWAGLVLLLLAMAYGGAKLMLWLTKRPRRR